MAVLKKRQRIILAALKDLGGVATTRQIAEKTDLNVNGVSQTLGSSKYVWCLGGRGGETQWKLKYSALEAIREKEKQSGR